MPSPYRDASTMSMGEINRELDELTSSVPATLERQAELFDALLTGNGGMGPARRAMRQPKGPGQFDSTATKISEQQPEPHPTTNPVFRKWLKNPRFRKIEGPQDGGIVITGYGPITPRSKPAPTSTESPKPTPEASHDHE